MSRPVSQGAGFTFDGFYIDPQNRRLLREGEPVALNSKYFDVLLMLVSNRGRLVDKQHIFDEVWDGVFVTDAALTQCIKDIRRQLGDDASNPRYIKTVPKHGYVFIGEVVEAGTGGSAAGIAPAPRPYKFLDYYTRHDSHLFFGREAETEVLRSQVITHRSFILHGRSGVGKSSILRAGLMPRLAADGNLVFVVRSFTDPVHQIASELLDHLRAESAEEGGEGIDALVRKAADLAPGHLVVFVFDQFEEYFTLLPGDVRGRFADAISKLYATDSLPVRLVFALREDLLAEMSQLKSAIPEIFHHEYRLGRLSRENAARAIAEPAKAVGCSYQPQLIARLLDDLSDDNGVDPPQLQIVCDNLYDARDGSELTIGTYEKLGTATRILAGYLERVLRRFNSADLAIAKEVLAALISADGSRLVLRPRELRARIAPRVGSGADSVDRMIEELVAARVVRRRNFEGEGWLELAHDFLTPEVSRWLSAEDVALKRARGVIERAMENYRAHGLMIDADVLELLLPFGARLGLTGSEADLVMMSVVNRGGAAPEWVVSSAPGSLSVLLQAAQSSDPNVRLGAVEGCSALRNPEVKSVLRKLALWDPDLGVRKAASIALAEWLGAAAEDLLANGDDREHVGRVRRAISLAIIRDHDKRLIRFSRMPIPIGVLVFLGLLWVRLRRGGAEIVMQGARGTLGGAASGLVGGLLLGLGLSGARHAAAPEAVSLILVLISMGTFIGGIGGLGVSFGMAAASHIAYRHSRWWSVVGAAAGGAAIGGSTKLLGVDTLKALFGRSTTGITGSLEGAAIGAGVALGVVLAARLMTNARPWHRVLGAAIGAMCGGVLLTVIGGNLFSGSLEIVARSFADSQIRLEPLAPFFGEVHFGKTTQIVLGAIEGLLFGGGVSAGLEIGPKFRPGDAGTPVSRRAA